MNIKVGTRASALATTQTAFVVSKLVEKFPSLKVETLHITTTGDREQDIPLHKMTDKGVFTKELERALLDGSIDFAVHSLKDLPTVLPPGLVIGAVLEREDPCDSLLLPQKDGQSSTKYPASTDPRSILPPKPRIGTSSLRRKAQILKAIPDAEITEIRGNVPTRIAKLDRGDFDAIVLATSGLKRLGLQDRISMPLSECMNHAVGQGALAIECRESATELLELLSALHDPLTYACCQAERALLRELEGGCRVPIGVRTCISKDGSAAWSWGSSEGVPAADTASAAASCTPIEKLALTRLNGIQLNIIGGVYSVDGKSFVVETHAGLATDAEKLGVELAKTLNTKGASVILEAVYSSGEGMA